MKKRIALVVGATDDVGRAVSLKLAEGGATLVLVDSQAEKLHEVSRSVEVTGAKAETHVLDTTDATAVESAVTAILEKYATIDVLINNIDHKNGQPLAEGTLEDWTQSLAGNVVPIANFCLNIIPIMRKNKYGRIVNIGSLDYLGSAGKANYSTAKSALFGLTRALALELSRDGITVNQVIKGDLKKDANPLSEVEEEQAAAKIPVQRLGVPADIAHAAAYFAAESSSYVTGQNLIVCGGKSIYSSMSA